MEFETRILEARDIGEAVELLRISNDGVSRKRLEIDLRRLQRRWPQLQWCATRAGRIAGVVTGRIDPNDRRLGWSDDTVVAEVARGAGVGGRLVDTQLAAFRAMGCARVRGLTARSRLGALGFFRTHGFHVVDRVVARGLFGIRDGEEVFVTEAQLEQPAEFFSPEV